MGGLQITPQNVRAGADRIGAEKATVTGIAIPDGTAAMSGLPGFATAAALADAHDRVVASLMVVGGRYERMAELCRNCAKQFELADLVRPGVMSLPKMLGDGLGGLGDLNRAVPGR